MAREPIFSSMRRRSSSPTAPTPAENGRRPDNYKAFFGCFHVHTISLAWGVYQLLAHSLALLVLMFFACRLHKAQQEYVAQQQRLMTMFDDSSLPTSITADGLSSSSSNNDMVEISSTSYLLIQQSNNSFLELVISSDNSPSDSSTPSTTNLLDTSALLFRGVPVGKNNDNGAMGIGIYSASDSDLSQPSAAALSISPSSPSSSSWAHLQLSEGKITARELRLGFFATLMALLTVGMFLYGIVSKKPLWMIPHFAIQVLDVVIGTVTFIGVVFYAPRIDRYFHLHYAVVRHAWAVDNAVDGSSAAAVAAAAADDDADDNSGNNEEANVIMAERMMLAFLLGAMLLLILLKTYVLCAVFRCMYYFMDLRQQIIARRTSTIRGTARNGGGGGAYNGGYAELGSAPIDADDAMLISPNSNKAAIYAVMTSPSILKKNSLPRYETAVGEEFAGVPPPPYSVAEKQQLPM